MTTKDNSRSDADARGEHDYTERPQPPETAPEGAVPLRRPGHYVAGAEGTQDVTGTGEPERPPDKRSKP
jgi:hypothetical protein